MKSKPGNHLTCIGTELTAFKVRYKNAIADNNQVYNSVRIGGTGVEGQMVAWKVPVLCCTVSACHRGYSMVDMYVTKESIICIGYSDVHVRVIQS